ncbi:MAG: beta-phosphoglucomutase [Clostridiaceae bacterium]|nr:beta-phosphoglucomutase [Eubacteriales bacterium]
MKKPILKGIIFDLDGVLVHTDEMHYQAWKQIADRIGAAFNREINNRLRGVSRMESLEIILENAKPVSDAEKLILADEKNAAYKKFLETLSEEDVDGDVRMVLRELKNRGIKLAIGSSSKNARFILEQIKLTDFFDAISDGNNIQRSKPDPEVFLKAAEFLMLEPAECAVVEDAYAGIDAAVAGGFYSVGIGDASGYDRADMKIRRIAEVLNLVNP